jgi:hypothetical protein
VKQPIWRLVIGGYYNGSTLASMDRYDLSLGQWSVAAAMRTKRSLFGATMSVGELYVTGGLNARGILSSVEKYTPSSDSWSTLAPLPSARCQHAAVAVASATYWVAVMDLCYRVFLSSTAHRTLGVQSGLCLSQDGYMLQCAIGLGIIRIHRPSIVFGGSFGLDGSRTSSVFKYDTEANTCGGQWRPCHSLALITVSVCSMAM